MIDTDRIQLDKLQKFNQLPPLKVVEVVEQEDGAVKVIFDLNQEFRKQYKEVFGLKKWSDKHFERSMIEAVQKFVDDQKENRQVQNPDFLWTRPEENNE